MRGLPVSLFISQPRVAQKIKASQTPVARFGADSYIVCLSFDVATISKEARGIGVQVRGLTFEVTCERQRDALARQGIMSIARNAGQVWHAVARQVHRRVRLTFGAEECGDHVLDAATAGYVRGIGQAMVFCIWLSVRTSLEL
jgi:hypothetical protein